MQRNNIKIIFNILFLLFAVATASLHGRRGAYDYPLKGIPPQSALCNLIFEFFEDNKVKTFGAFLDKKPNHSLNLIMNRSFGIYEKREEEFIYGETTFRKLLAKRKTCTRFLLITWAEPAFSSTAC